MNRVHSALLGLLLVTQACSSLPVAQGDRDLTVSEGSTFQVVLAGPSGSGRFWTVDGVEAGTVELLRREPLDISPTRSNGPAEGEQQTFVFLAKRAGTVTLRFTYGRSWGASSPATSPSYRVQVIRC